LVAVCFPFVFVDLGLLFVPDLELFIFLLIRVPFARLLDVLGWYPMESIAAMTWQQVTVDGQVQI
jgi:hypothetical protein